MHAGARDAEARLSERVSRLWLVTFLGGAAWMVWTFSGVVTPLPVAIGVAVFVASARSSSGTRESKSA